MTTELPDGTVIKGRVDHRPHIKRLNLDELDIKGANMLDIAANDGFWSFWARGKGANVTAIDVDKFEDYDWGWEIPKNSGLNFSFDKSDNFKELNDKYFKYSDIRREKLSVYDIGKLNDKFEIIFNYGLMYHLRHPLLALDKIRQNCSDEYCMINYSTITDNKLGVPYSIFLKDNALDRAHTNWNLINTDCMVSMMKDSGFKHIFTEKTYYNKTVFPKIFIGCSDKYFKHFSKNKNLVHHTDECFKKLNEEVTKFIYGD